jgi:hypothetical protein
MLLVCLLLLLFPSVLYSSFRSLLLVFTQLLASLLLLPTMTYFTIGLANDQPTDHRISDYNHLIGEYRR